MIRYEMYWDSRKFWLYGSVVLLLLFFLASSGLLSTMFGGAGGPAGATTGSTSTNGTGLVWLDRTLLLAGTVGPGFVAFLVAEASASGTVGRERDKGTLAALLAQPLRRSEIFLGKYLAKLLVFLAFSVGIVLGMIAISTAVSGPQLYLAWAAVVILDLTMIFAFYAAFAQFLSCFFRRSRSVFFIIVLTWFLLVGLMGYATLRRVNLLPYAYFVPINTATFALAGTQAYLINPNGFVPVALQLPIFPLLLGTDSTFQFAVMATTGLVLGTILFLVLGWWAFRRIEIKG